MPGRAPLPAGALEALEREARSQVIALQAGLAQRDWALPPRMLTRMMEWERAFVAAGGLLGAGSDPWGTGNLPGVGNLRNFELLIEAGFAPEEAVQIMTLNGARIVGEMAQRRAESPSAAASPPVGTEQRK